MMKNFVRTLMALAAVLAFAMPVFAQTTTSATAASSSKSGWESVLYPVYAWVPVFGVDVKLPEVPTPPGSGGGGVTIPSADLKSNMNGAAFFGFRTQKGRWSVGGDFLYAGLTAEASLPKAKVSSKFFFYRAAGQFELVKDKDLFVEIGVRRIGLRLTADIADFDEVQWKPGITESQIGLTYRPMLTKSLRLILRGALGGLEDPDHQTTDLNGILEWTPKKHFLIAAGYGQLTVTIDGKILTKSIHLHQNLYGPIVAIGIPF